MFHDFINKYNQNEKLLNHHQISIIITRNYLGRRLNIDNYIEV